MLTVKFSLNGTSSIFFDHAFSTNGLNDLFKPVIFIGYVLSGALFMEAKVGTTLHFLELLLKLSGSSDAFLPVLVEFLFLSLVCNFDVLETSVRHGVIIHRKIFFFNH